MSLSQFAKPSSEATRLRIVSTTFLNRVEVDE